MRWRGASGARDNRGREAFQDALARECRATLAQRQETLHLDDQRLLDQVVGAGGTPESFLYGGFVTSVAIRALMRMVGRPVTGFRTILDFGCGPGRVTHWFRDLVPRSGVLATDINPDAIAWCRRNIRMDASFLLNGPLPPLPLSDGSVDFIYAISVFTHLDEQYQFEWLRELWRILRPGGFLLATFHGEDKAETDLSTLKLAAFRRRGFLYRSAGGDPTVVGLPDFYQVAYHSPRYVARKWARYFDPILSVSHGPFWTQYAVVFRRAEQAGRAKPLRRPPRMVRLPFAALSTPAPGEPLHGESVAVSGWASYPERGGPVSLEMWIDGKLSATAATDEVGGNMPSPQSAATNAEGSEFNVELRLPRLHIGPHTLWVTTPDSNVPASATYFEIHSA